MERYFIEKGSNSGHCCFSVSVMDNSSGETLNGRWYPECICECFDEDVAEMICKTLNEKENK